MTQHEDGSRPCEVCGILMPPSPRGRTRLTCSGRCRSEKYDRARGVQPARGKWAPHGGSGRRYEDGCRCDECRAAHAARKKRNLARRYAEGPPPGMEHGIRVYDGWGCRCDICRAAKSVRNAEYRRKVAAGGVS